MGDRPESLRVPEFAVLKFAFQSLPLSRLLSKPYFLGECEIAERRKPFGDVRLENNFARESKWVFGVNPSMETLG